jgi:hypothetical protein
MWARGNMDFRPYSAGSCDPLITRDSQLFRNTLVRRKRGNSVHSGTFRGLVHSLLQEMWATDLPRLPHTTLLILCIHEHSEVLAFPNGN